MWNKNQDQESSPEPSAPESRRSRAESPRPGTGGVATLGPSINVKGNLSGQEDLLIQGKVEGKVTLQKHNVTIAETGKVKADVYGRSISVEGQVIGNLFGDEQVVIRRSGRVEGNLTAPRVTLENGAKFRGSVDMQPQGQQEPQKGGKQSRAPRGAAPVGDKKTGDRAQDGGTRSSRDTAVTTGAQP